MSRCTSCGSEIVWAVTALGKRMPVDPAPAENGNIRLDDIGLPDPQAVVVSSAGRAAHPGVLHLSHFATCVNAAQHRRPR